MMPYLIRLDQDHTSKDEIDEAVAYYDYRVSLKSSHVNSMGSADDGFATFIGLDSHSSHDCIGDIEQNITVDKPCIP